MDSAQWDERYAGTELLWSGTPNRFVESEFAGLTPGRALDLGAGEGRNAIWLASQGWRVTAVDFSAVAIDRGRRLAGQAGVEVDWVVADVGTYTPAEAAFDAVLVAYLHLEARLLASVLAAARRALAPGGTLLVVGHDRLNLTEGVGGPQNPELLYTPDAIVDELPGLSVLRADRVSRDVTTDEGARAAIDTLVRARRD